MSDEKNASQPKSSQSSGRPSRDLRRKGGGRSHALSRSEEQSRAGQSRSARQQADHLLARLDECGLLDRARIRSRIRRLRDTPAKKRHAHSPGTVSHIETEIERAIARRASRSPSGLRIEYPSVLPVSGERDRIAELVRDNQVVIVCGETGSGKTTQLPKIMLELGRGLDGEIAHTQPRRLAARSVAQRIAKELQEPLGKRVGYKVRFDDKSTDQTLIKVVTDGTLLAEISRDRKLLRYDTIIIDEAHERSLNIDFLLGYLRTLLPRRPDLKLIITSATIDPERFANHFATRGTAGEVIPAPIVEVSGRTFPVTVEYLPPQELTKDADFDPSDLVVEAARKLDSEHPPTGAENDHVLVFLPGERDIREAAAGIRKLKLQNTETLPLYARLAASDQDKIFSRTTKRRIILSTNIAETSLTVPGVKYVIDTGIARMSRYSARSHIQRLPIEPVSRASADQRKGRCGRVAAGICYRLYEEEEFRQRPQFTDPEILRTDLAAVILQMKSLGLGSVSDFPFIDPPKHSMIREGEQTLYDLGALDEHNEITTVGRQLSRFQIDPRSARMLLAGSDEDALDEVLIIAAALSIQDPRERPSDRADAADRAHEKFIHEGSDFLTLLNMWRWFRELQSKKGSSNAKRACVASFVNHMRMREWVDLHRQLRQTATDAGLQFSKPSDDPDAIHRSLLAGLVRNIGYREEKYEYTGPGSTSFFLSPSSALFEERPKWVVAAEVIETERRFARMVSPISPEWVEQVTPHLVTRSHSDPYFNARKGKVMAKEKVSLAGLTLVNNRSVHYGPVNPEEAREIFLYQGLVLEEWPSRGRFISHNRELIEEIERMEAKQRRRDILVDVAARYEFYSSRIPKSIYTGEEFERWRQEVEREEPHTLFMTEQDLVEDEAEVQQELFPDHIDAGATRLPLSYKLEPGSKDDGVTVTVPIEALGQIADTALAWPVPGMLVEKLIAMLRTLPKSYRRSFVPAPTIAAQAAEQLRSDYASLSSSKTLPEAVTDVLHRITGTRVPLELWRETAVSEHLKTNIKVVNEDGETIAEGRDISAIKRALKPQMRSRLESLGDDRWARTNIKDWDFGELPQRITIEREGGTVAAYPALADDGAACRIRLFESQAAAEAQHRIGLRRLFQLRAREELQAHAQYLPDFDQIAVLYAPLGSPAELRSQLELLVADQLFIGDRPNVRDQRIFDARIDAGWHRIGEVTTKVCDLALLLLQNLHATQLALESPPRGVTRETRLDIEEQLQELMTPRFLVQTPLEWLIHYPRYMKAMQIRLERAGREGGVLDAQSVALVLPHERQYRAILQQRPDAIEVSAEFAELKWLLQEYRVSLFAQQLRTAVSISEQRLNKHWRSCRI